MNSDSSQKKIWIEVYGWYGALGLLAAYTAVSLGLLTPESVLYQVVNITAALGIVTVSMYKGAYQPGLLNIVWALVGITSLVKILQ